jgi:DNA-binding LytR/AlgR family response regulator
MNILLIEDEPQAARRLEKLVKSILPDSKILASIDSVRNSVQWFQSNAAPELIFMDIQLADGVSFKIFEQVEIKSPVIFTTAYDEYALKAFKVNSIDYILKPVDEQELRSAIQKFQRLRAAATEENKMENISLAIQMLTRRYKERFVIKIGERLKSVDTDDILFFFSMEKATFAQTKDGKKHILDFTLDQVEELIDPQKFFRINRKYIVQVKSIQEMFSYTNSRLRLLLKMSDDHEIIVARERVQLFKDWFDK